MSEHVHAGGAAAGPQVSPFKLISTLTVFGAVAGLLIVVVFQLTQPAILRNQAAATETAIRQVLVGGTEYQTLFVHEGKLVADVPVGVDTVPMEKVYTAKDAEGKQMGYAILGTEPGFADNIKLIFGYDAAAKQVLGLLVIEQKETPGLGDKIVKDTAFVNGFTRVTAPLKGVKVGQGKGTADEVDMITGATISSRITIGIINHQLERLGPLIDAYEKAGGV